MPLNNRPLTTQRAAAMTGLPDYEAFILTEMRSSGLGISLALRRSPLRFLPPLGP
jgi:hypothetical protein